MNKTMAGMALAAIVLAFGAQAQDGREGPIEIDKCQTISQPGSYKLVNNLTVSGPSGGTCLPITVSNVTIDLAGFSIISLNPQAVAIAATPPSGQSGGGHCRAERLDLRFQPRSSSAWRRLDRRGVAPVRQQ